jgi:hypothetical protein
MGILAKIAKICDKTDGISARIDRTFKETAAIFDKTTATCEQTVKRCGRTRGLGTVIGSNSDKMNNPGEMPGSCNKTAKICGTTGKTCTGIGRTCELIARTGGQTGVIF